ncbi:MAG: DnaA ATPase domain-containing protein [Planctomycetaceae bacterium]
MAKAPGGAIAVLGGDAGTAIREAVRGRIGADRFAVWFGNALEVRLDRGAAGVERVVVQAGSGFTHDWLRRTFQADVSAAIATICGPVRVVWEQAAPAPPASSASISVAAVPGRRRRPPAVAPAAAPCPGAPRRAAPALESFVAGPSNRMAVAAATRAATEPGEISPLVIHGPSGVGKTHLLEAAGARARELHPQLPVVSLSAEQFTTGFLQALHGGGLPGFRRSCRAAGLFVVDDIQFLVGKRATLLEFQQTVDALHRAGRQMLFACDRELDALPGLGSELLTRLRGGMTARIAAPDYEVRRGVVAALAAARGLAVPDDVVHYVATHMTRHARELHGAVNRLEATSLMLGVPIDAGMAREALADLVRSSARSVRLADVDRAVCRSFGIEDGALQSARRARHASHARMLAMFLARKHTHAALAEIGRHFGRRSHSTVIAAQKTVTDWLATGEPIVIADARWDVDEAIRRVEELLRAG